MTVEYRHRVFILGAGFSIPAGYPTAVELWHEIRRRADRLGGRAARFQVDLEAYLNFKHSCDDVVGLALDRDEIDFEDFCRFLDIEHFLGLRGSDTWSVDGNESTIIVKTLIGQVLAEKTPEPDRVPALYLEFARRLRPHDIVITFNYDVLLERALDNVRQPYRLFSNRYKYDREFGAVVGDSRPEVILLKFHGSIDWFDRGQYAEFERLWKRSGSAKRPTHPVFGPSGADLVVAKLVAGPGHSDDPMKYMYRVENVRLLYQRPWLFSAAPWLLAPSSMKILYSTKLADFWYGLGGMGTWNGDMAIIGYSLPPQDEYAKQAVYRMVTNYQNRCWGEDMLGRIKTPLVLVDFRKDDQAVQEIRERYGFVDWDRAVTHYDGFDERMLDLIFGN